MCTIGCNRFDQSSLCLYLGSVLLPFSTFTTLFDHTPYFPINHPDITDTNKPDIPHSILSFHLRYPAMSLLCKLCKMITSALMMEGTCQTCIKQLIDSKYQELAVQTQIASKQTTEDKAPQTQSTGDWSFAQFQKSSNNPKDWRLVKQNFREDKSMERQRLVLSSTKSLVSSKKEYQFQAKIAMYHQGRISHMNLPAARELFTIPLDSQTQDPTSFYHLVLSKIYLLFLP